MTYSEHFCFSLFDVQNFVVTLQYSRKKQGWNRVKDLPIFQSFKRDLNVLTKRYQIHAEDLAHRDTPGRKSRDIDPKALEGNKSAFQHHIKMARTNPKHIHHVTSTGPEPKIKTDKSKEHMDLNGNNIDAEAKLQLIAETGYEFEERATQFRMAHDMIRMFVKK